LQLKLFNSLSRKKEVFKPIKPFQVGIYVCGPTVYDYAHIGNLRTYTLFDIVQRIFKYLGYRVKSVMNITDVGHLTSDADTGEDKLEKGARREGKTAGDIAKKYTQLFLRDIKQLNILSPAILCKATEHLKEQIELIQRLEKKGCTYKTSDGLYFDTSKFPGYGELAQLDIKGLREGARVEKNPEKRNPTDFALWKFSPPSTSSGLKRQMEWDSPWGVGFPGWHIECSAMSMKYLGETFDIHLGGVDLKPVHHTNEIAQSEAATGKRFVNYWLHGEFILVNSEKMSKSKGNFYKLHDIEEKGFDPLALRYFYLNTHYRQQMNFTWEALEGAQTALDRLRQLANRERSDLLPRSDLHGKSFKRKFVKAISDDINMPEALAVAWEVARSNLDHQEKRQLLLDFDRVLGLDLDKLKVKSEKLKVEEIKDKNVKELVLKREKLRKAEKWAEADEMRRQIEKKGYFLEDTSKGTRVKKA
jgi:cysteinyl-tRNA synthetase